VDDGVVHVLFHLLLGVVRNCGVSAVYLLVCVVIYL
jgi:hypothetical protein